MRLSGERLDLWEKPHLARVGEVLALRAIQEAGNESRRQEGGDTPDRNLPDGRDASASFCGGVRVVETRDGAIRELGLVRVSSGRTDVISPRRLRSSNTNLDEALRDLLSREG